MTYFFHDGYCVSHFFWMLTKFYQTVKKLFNIGHVEISRHNQISVHPIVLTQKRMNTFNAVFAKSSVANMA